MVVKHGFELIKEQEIPELNTMARLYRHQKTGAELLSLENEDENKVFGITFRTPPDDSTGLPHIMEHSVLCGSKRFPVKEPFVELLKGSLKTFVNAFTFPDKTCYPVASQNTQDLYNLIDVYMDAVLHPLITEQTLQQEGWHYELERLEDPLVYKGVVFNEMKGTYSSPDNVLSRFSQQSLFPDTTYGVDSGGDPRVIPDLTYEKFKRFHETYYHPSNARIFFYGDDDPEERLRRMNEYLREFERIEVNSQVAVQKPFDKPRRVTIPYAVGEDESEAAAGGKKTMVTINFLLPEVFDSELTLGLHILDYILIGTSGSPLRKALIDSGLGEDLAGVGLESDLRQMYYSTGLKGIAEEDVEKVENLILDTLRSLAENGIDRDLVEAAFNTTEFRLRENNTGSFPRGIALMLRSLTTWLHDGDPVAPLAFEAPLNALRKRLEAGEPYFETLIRKYMLNNNHRSTVVLRPDPTLRQRMEAEERERLEQVRKSLSQEELEGIIAATKELKRRQEAPDSPEALASIPALRLEDLEPEVKRIPIEVSEEAGVKVLYHDIFTNGIIYLDLGFDLHNLPQEMLPYVPLFGRALTEMGTEHEDFVQLSRRIGRSTGGVHAAPFTSAIRGQERSAAWLFLRGKATPAHGQDLLGILRDVLLTVMLDNRERFRQMVLEEKAMVEARLVPAGHQVVNTRLKAKFNEAGWVAEQMGGVSYLFFLRKLADAVDQDWPGVLEKLETVRRLLLNRGTMVSNVTLDEKNWSTFRPLLADFLAELPNSKVEPAAWQREADQAAEGLVIPAQVNYVAKGANLYELGYELDGSIHVITNYLGTTWMWERVRVQGGAYGGFSVFDRHSGIFSFLSYRDPNLVGTLQNYDGTAGFLRRLALSEDERVKAIIGTIGEMDAYQLPDARGFTSMVRYLLGETDEFRQKLREQVLDTTEEDFHRFADVLERLNEAGRVVVLGSQDAIRAANESRPGWFEIKRVL
jgi:Zn-dependent M16 (insulinase) family peptidase